MWTSVSPLCQEETASQLREQKKRSGGFAAADDSSSSFPDAVRYRFGISSWEMGTDGGIVDLLDPSGAGKGFSISGSGSSGGNGDRFGVDPAARATTVEVACAEVGPGRYECTFEAMFRTNPGTWKPGVLGERACAETAQKRTKPLKIAERLMRSLGLPEQPGYVPGSEHRVHSYLPGPSRRRQRRRSRTLDELR
jgi:hypothetical protein